MPKRVVMRAETLIVSDGKVLICSRRKKPSEYVFPGGHHDKGETIKDTAVRETMEEVGYQLDPEKLKPIDVIHSSDDNDDYATTFFIYQDDELINKQPSAADDVRKSKWVRPDDAMTSGLLPEQKKILARVFKLSESTDEISDYYQWLGLIGD